MMTDYNSLIGKEVEVSWSATGKRHKRILISYLPEAMFPFVCVHGKMKPGYSYSGWSNCWPLLEDQDD